MFVQPLRFSTYPDVVLDVVVETPLMGAAAESITSQNPPSYTSTSPKKSDIGSTSDTPALTKGSNDTQNPITERTSRGLDESQEISASSPSESIAHSSGGGSISVDPRDEEVIDEDYVRGVAYLEGWNIRQDCVKALDFLFKAAHREHAPAQCRLWDMRHNPQTVDYSEIVEKYLAAAKQGNADAQFNMGYMYEMGYGVVVDYSTSMEWYQKAADQGHAYAQCSLGFMHHKGYGVAQSYSKALKWYQKAADQGNPTAQCCVGNIYDFAHGVPRDPFKAFIWYQKSANQGYTNAQVCLGNMYNDGSVLRDKRKAIEWWTKAASQGNVEAKKKLAEH
ncbi:hypothetical protein BGZ79_008868 [Entomortierella chlamydospora]|nr:hypothetical protein BGZ79_008868 [Entomortierella chlamydospora]